MKKYIILLGIVANGLNLLSQSLAPLNAPFTEGQPLQFAYTGGTGSPQDWVGIYQAGQVPGQTPSTVWQYVPTTSGQVEFAGTLPPGVYDAHLFCCNGYDILASHTDFTIGGSVLRSRLDYYKLTDSIKVSAFGGMVGDEIRVYHAADFANGSILANATPLAVQAISNANQTVYDFAPLASVGNFVVLIVSGAQVAAFDPFEVRPVPMLPPIVTRIGLGSCASQNLAQPTLANILNHDIDLFLYLGDNLYIDTYNPNVLRSAYEQFITNRAEYQQLRSSVPVLATWDDHDYGCCDEDADYPHKVLSQQVFLDFFEEPANSPRRTQEGIHTSYLIGPEGQRLQIILLDTRYHLDDRRPNNGCGINDYCPWDSPADSTKTMLGAAQWAWLKTELEQPADLRLVASSVQFSSSYHGFESWRLFPHERERFQELVKETGAEHLFLVSGDMHYSEVSKLANAPGIYPLYDFTASGITNTWPPAANQNRVGTAYGGANVGLIEIDWQDKTVQYKAMDVADAVRVEYVVPFEEMEFGATATTDVNGRNALIFKQVPTPGQGGARLVFDGKTSGELVLYDLMGRAVCSMAIENEEVVLVGELPPGVYVARLQRGEQNSATRVLVE